MSFQDELKTYIFEKGANDVGFFQCDDGPLGYGISIVVRLSEAIISEINNEPTLTYFNHYRQVNAYIDRILLETGLFLQNNGFKYITVAASQSFNKDGWNYSGRYSHKKAACLAGLGTVGRNSLFLHKQYGSLVRLGTVFTDCVLESGDVLAESICGNCRLCVDSCPAGAIKYADFKYGMDRNDIFSPEKCSEYMKRNFQNIGRGSVCGICMKVCPKNKL